MQANRSTPFIDPVGNRHQFLKLAIQPDVMAIVAIECAIELMNIPVDRVVPMPHLPPAVRGVYNWRGEILWIVDLAVLLGLGASERDRKLQPTVVLSSSSQADVGLADRGSQPQSSQKTIGFIVEEIIGIELCQLDLSSGTLPAPLDSELAKLVWGVWKSPTGEDCLVLDGSAILDRANIHADVRWRSLSSGESDLNHFFR